jgi:mono/diheme cytochrome c family protein
VVPDEFDPQDGELRASSASSWVLVVLVGMILLGAVAYTLLRPDPGPPPMDISGDPLLVEGRTLYLERCASCHGETGIGDGPVARINEVPPGNLADDEWKYGDRPEDVLTVIGRGIGNAMPGWEKTFREPQMAAIAAYVYHLAGREVPASLRATGSGSDPVGAESD